MDGIKFKTENVELELDSDSSDAKTVALDWEMNISFSSHHIYQMSLYVPKQKIVFRDDNCSMHTVVIPDLLPSQTRFSGCHDILPFTPG